MLANQPKVFDHEMFGSIQIVTIEGKEMFGATHVALALGYKDPNSAVRQHCKSEGAVIHPVLTSGGTQQMKFISEGNVYRLISRSKLPAAEQFEKWLFDEVLPTMRKTGGYVADDELFIRTYLPHADETTQGLFRVMLASSRQANEQLAIVTPKAEKYDAFLDSEGCASFSTVGKQFLGGMSAIRLREWLQDNGILYQRKVDSYYPPTKGYEHYFKITLFTSDFVSNKHLKVTPAGIDMMVDLFYHGIRPEVKQAPKPKADVIPLFHKADTTPYSGPKLTLNPKAQ